MKNRFSIFLFIGLTAFFMVSAGQTETAAYDRYASIYPAKTAKPSSQISYEFLSYPFELVKWPADKTLNFIEDYKIGKKVKWLLDEIQQRGFYPYSGYNSRLSVGTHIDFVQLLNQKANYPNVIVKGVVGVENDESFYAGSEIGWQDLSNTGLGAKGIFDYERRPEEDFYGIGPDTSRGEGSTYKMEATEIGGVLLYQVSPIIKSQFKLAYRNINISNGEDDGKNIIDKIFPAGSIQGLAGDELLDFELDLAHDTRNHKELSTHGGLRRFNAGFHKGVAGSEAEYFKYNLELSQYFALGSERRVLMLRFFGEHNSGDNIAFHQMARLGGMGIAGRTPSRTMRGYDYNRFFGESSLLLNIEYRYTVWEYRDFKLDAILFWDEGQVFNGFSRAQLKDFNESYGLGFRLSAANNLLLDFEIAHADEGTNFYAKSKTAF